MGEEIATGVNALGVTKGGVARNDKKRGACNDKGGEMENEKSGENRRFCF